MASVTLKGVKKVYQQAGKDVTAVHGVDLEVKDGELVVIHDPTLERTTTGGGPVKDRTVAELKALRAQVDPHFLFNTLNAVSISPSSTLTPCAASR